ncbi:MAG: ribonuclease III [Frankia sp.]
MTRSLPPPAPQADLLVALEVSVEEGLLHRALTHRSYAYENGGLPTNERLEFLGDAVLGLVITDALYTRHPELPEGQLAKQRASVVNMRALATVARRIGDGGIGPYLLLGRGEESTGGRDKASILADTLEALIGAVYLSDGLSSTTTLIHRLFGPLLDAAADLGAGLDWKTSLQELTALHLLGPPEYVVAESGPDHAKRFTARALVAGAELGRGEGGSKKEAEQRAAATAFEQVRIKTSGSASGEAPAHAAGADGGPS